MDPVVVHAPEGFWSGVEEGVADADNEDVEGGSLLPVSGLADGDDVVHPLIATSTAMPATGRTKR
jgi:nitrogen fixation protein